MKEDAANDAGSGIVAALPATAPESGGNGGGPATLTGGSPASTAPHLKLFVVKVDTDVTNKLYGLDSEMAQARRQVMEHKAYSEALEEQMLGMVEALHQQERAMSQMQQQLAQHGLASATFASPAASEGALMPRASSVRDRTLGMATPATPDRGDLVTPLAHSRSLPRMISRRLTHTSTPCFGAAAAEYHPGSTAERRRRLSRTSSGGEVGDGAELSVLSRTRSGGSDLLRTTSNPVAVGSYAVFQEELATFEIHQGPTPRTRSPYPVGI
jgi:hypothetical protein